MHAKKQRRMSEYHNNSLPSSPPLHQFHKFPHPNLLVPNHQASALPTCQTPNPVTVCNPKHSVILPAYPSIPFQPPLRPIPNQLFSGYTSALNFWAASWLAGDEVAAARKPRATERMKRVSRGRRRRQLIFPERSVQRMLVG